MATELILGVPFFSPELAKRKFDVVIPSNSYFTDVGMCQIFLTKDSKSTWKCTVWVQGTQFAIDTYAPTKEECVFNSLDKIRESINNLPRIEKALLECYSTFDVPTKKISLL